jgi:hypothetical protein
MLKKIISLIIAASMFIGCLSAMAASTSGSSVSLPTIGQQSINLTHGTGINNTVGSSGQLSAMATDYIASVALDIYYVSPTQVRIVGDTSCFDTMNKVGIQNIQLQKWVNNSWVNVFNRTGYFANNDLYTYDCTTTVASGYCYRCVGTHFAEKDILFIPFTETFYNETGYVYIG